MRCVPRAISGTFRHGQERDDDPRDCESSPQKRERAVHGDDQKRPYVRESRDPRQVTTRLWCHAFASPREVCRRVGHGAVRPGNSVHRISIRHAATVLLSRTLETGPYSIRRTCRGRATAHRGILAVRGLTGDHKRGPMSEDRSQWARRWFLAKTGGLAALGAVFGSGASAAGAQVALPADARWQPARHAEDDSFDRVPGTHRLFFDTVTAEGFGEAMRFSHNYFTANKSGYGLEDRASPSSFVRDTSRRLLRTQMLCGRSTDRPWRSAPTSMIPRRGRHLPSTSTRHQVTSPRSAPTGSPSMACSGVACIWPFASWPLARARRRLGD